MGDDRLIPILSKALGKEFFKKNKQPIPVRIHKCNNWSKEFNKALAGTYTSSNLGNCISIKVGRCSQTREELLENIVSIVEQMSEIVPGKLSNLQGIFIRAKQTVSLPIYQNLPTNSEALNC